MRMFLPLSFALVQSLALPPTATSARAFSFSSPNPLYVLFGQFQKAVLFSTHSSLRNLLILILVFLERVLLLPHLHQGGVQHLHAGVVLDGFFPGSLLLLLVSLPQLPPSALQVHERHLGVGLPVGQPQGVPGVVASMLVHHLPDVPDRRKEHLSLGRHCLFAHQHPIKVYYNSHLGWRENNLDRNMGERVLLLVVLDSC